MPTGKISNLSDEIVIDPVVAEIIDHNTENFHQEYQGCKFSMTYDDKTHLCEAA